ncbi:hypothetical protein TanjilG_15055 [Lupinus angustifolius]|uniref:Uncharacterized protein n=1 Tax=Lupinus angustifolius TaxID=3871 RepID=A0A394DFV8_LUPAN|nr:hypothetical protein TanjilG_15055 [Lupinus angustifolius]
MEVDSDDVGSDEHSGGLSPPSEDGGNDARNVEGGESDEEGEQMHNDPYEEMSLHRRDRNLFDVTSSRSGMVHSSDSFNDSNRIESQSRRGKKKQNITLEDASSSSLAQSFSDFSIDETSQSSQGYNPMHPVYYPHGYYIHPQYESGQVSSHQSSLMNYQEPYYQQSSQGFFDYVFGQGHKMIASMTMKIMLLHAILACGNN